MYLIEPYKSIDNIFLESTEPEIEKILGKNELATSEYAPEYLNAFYAKGITISYKKNYAVLLVL